MDVEWFASLVNSGRLVDLILLAVAVEAIALIVYQRASGKGPAVIDLLPNLASGACLMIALRCALVHADWRTIVAALAASLIAHIFDLSRRWHTRRHAVSLN